LVDRCLSGQSDAWDELYHRFHAGLATTVRMLLGPAERDINLIDEIVARIWYALVSRNGELLGRFDVTRGCRLSTYLAQVARSEISSFFRSERRRRNRERIASKSGCEAAEDLTAAEFEEFLRTLTPREREFCGAVLLGRNPTAVDSFSPTNIWKLQSRIRRKLHRHLNDHFSP
jgi:DNA-directed RNA polymerase specialized sigma24 family protein